jgi:tetratricopeptide (TPR) repeat protein
MLFLWSCDRYNPSNDQIQQIPTPQNLQNEAVFQALKDATNNYPENPNAHYQMALYYLRTKKDTLALESIQKALKKDSTQNNYFITLAEIYRNTNQNAKALKAIQKLKNIDENYVELLLLAGELHYKQKEYDQATKELNRVLKITQKNAKAYFWKANVEIARLDSGNALKNLALALKYQPEYPEVYNSYAELFNKFEAYNTAILYANKGIKLNPQSSALYFSKAESFRLKRFSEDSANFYYLKAFQYNNQSWFSAFQIGKYAYNKWILKDSKKYFEIADKIQKNYPSTKYYLGITYYGLGKKEDAIKELDKCLKLEPNNLIASEWYWRIKNEVYQEKQFRINDSIQRAFYKKQLEMQKTQ